MKNLTDITVLLDRSGSMQAIKTDTVGGLNAFILAQQALPDAAVFSLVQFDGQGYDKVVDAKPLKDVAVLKDSDFQPRGDTPLLDSMARVINETGQRLEAMPVADRPFKVILVIITDGQENASVETTREKVFAQVKHQQEQYGWMFIYLGANQDAISVGVSMGVNPQHAATFAHNAIGTRASYSSTNRVVASVRGGQHVNSVSYTVEERDQMLSKK